MTYKTKSKTFKFLSENKSIEDILNQPNTTFKEKRRHGAVTYKLIEINNTNNQSVNDDLSENNRENLEPVTSNLINNEKEQEINNDIWTKLKNYLNWPTSNTEELIQVQKKYIEQLEQSNLEKDKENQQLKNEIEKLRQSKQSDVNLTKYTYNVVTIYNEKQRKKTGIEKIHEEILLIEDKIFFITTFVHINYSIIENVIFFQEDSNGNIQVINQIKNYQNINEYSKDISLIDQQNHNINKITVKEFLNQQTLEKIKPTKIERTLWYIFTVVTLLIVTSTLLLLIPPIAIIPAIAITIKATAGIMGGIRIFASLFSSATRKVDVWFGNKLYKNKEQKEKEKKERQSIIKNLSTDKLETKLQTQYDILKQELDNRKEKNPDKLINYKTINQNSNSILQNSTIESENNHNFDSSIRNTVNQPIQQPSTISKNTWNKEKCLLTT